MTDDQAFERATSDWLEAGSDRTPPRVTDAVLLAIRSTPQERKLPIPWRTNDMPYPIRIAAVLAIVTVVGLAALNVIGNGPWIGGPSTPTPSMQPSVTPQRASFEPLDTNGWVGFSSIRHGYEARRPDTSVFNGADAPLTFEFLASRNGEPFLAGDQRFVQVFDDMYDTFHAAGALYPIIGATSTRLPDGMSEGAWLGVYGQAESPRIPGCLPSLDQWQSILVDGVSGGVYSGCGYHEVLVFAGGRAYTFTITRGMGGAGGDDDVRLLLTFVSTVMLHPERADDSP